MLHAFVVQWNLIWEDRHANHQKLAQLLAGQDLPAGALVVVPEMFDTGFSMNPQVVIDDGSTHTFCQELARKRKITLAAGFGSRGDDGAAYNQLAIYTPDGLLHRYQKNHLFSLGGEPRVFSPGPAPSVVDLAGIKIAPTICYDLRFPELYRHATDLGAQMFLCIANWPTARVEHWMTLARARAIENQAYMIAVNRTGSDPKLEYPGRSLIIDPRGQILADAGAYPGVAGAKINVDHVREWRDAFPALRDRRRT